METPTINNFKPKDVLRKKPFTRLVPSEHLSAGLNGYPVVSMDAEYREDGMSYEILTQADFLREYDVNAHKINSIKYYPNPFSKDQEGKVYQKVKSRVAVPMQSIFHLKRTTSLTGKGLRKKLVSARVSENDQEKLAVFNEGWELKNMEGALHDAISADGKIGDVAVCFYLNNGIMGWRCLSYENGDTLYPHYDPVTGKLALLGRKYSMLSEDGKEKVQYLDVYDKTNWARYRFDKEGIKGAIAKAKETVGLDGWVLEASGAHGFNRVPVAYDRYGEPFWGQSQDLIDKIEISLSQLMENNSAYALRILLAFGQDMKVTADLDGTPSLIESSDPQAKAGFLEPADSSGSFGAQLMWLKNMAYKGSHVVDDPEIKSGADMSSLTVKMLYADAYLKGQDDADHFRPFIADIIELFTYGYSTEIGRQSEFSNFHIVGELEPFVFMSETEDVNALVQLRGIGVLSRRSGTERTVDMGYGVASEEERILQEEHDALVGLAAEQQTGQGQQIDASQQNPVNQARQQMSNAGQA